MEGFVLSETCIDSASHQAYLETEYIVGATPAVVLRIGYRSEGLAALQAAAGVSCSAFITAWNPRSQRLDAAVNSRRQQQLREELTRVGFQQVPGHGRHPSNGWPAEDSVLALGLDRDAAMESGHRWEQHAIVWCGPDAVPQLLLLR